MILIGAAGRARAGKDSVADILVAKHGFRRFSFSDALYYECQTAFGLADQSMLRDVGTKDVPLYELMLFRCTDRGFVEVARDHLAKHPTYTGRLHELYSLPLSPRWVLQLWGTEYRRAQNPDYWIDRADAWLQHAAEFGFKRFVNVSVRFANECDFIRGNGGHIWHVLRDSLPPMDNAGHTSEKPVPIRFGDFVVYNTGTLKDLEHRVDEGFNALLRRAA